MSSCQCSCYTLLRSSHRALSCASQIIFTNGLSAQSIYCFALTVTRKGWNYANFPCNPGKGLNILNCCSLLFIVLRFVPCLCFFYGKMTVFYCKVSCYVKGEPELTRQAHSLYSGVSEGCSPFHSACRQMGVLGLDSDFAPRQGQHRGRSVVGMLLCVCVCVCSPAAPCIWLHSCSSWECAGTRCQKVALQVL